MSLLDTFLRGSGGGGKLIAALGSLLPTRSKLNFATTDGTGIAGTDSSGTDTTTITLTHGAQTDGSHHAVAVPTGSVGAKHGFFHSDDKLLHDKHHACVKYVIGANDASIDVPAIQAAFADAQGATIVLRGKHKWDQTIHVEGTSGWTLTGAATGRSNDVGEGAIVEYTGPRGAGVAMIDAGSCTEVKIENIRWRPKLAEHVVLWDHGPSAADTHQTQFNDCPVDGSLNLITTSTTSWTPTTGSQDFIVGTGLSASFPVGSAVLVVSRSSLTSGAGAQALGVVTSYSGTTLTLSFGDADEIFNEKGGASADWDILTPLISAVHWEAATWGSSDGCTFTLCYHAFEAFGNEIFIGPRTSFGVGLGYQIYAGSGAGGVIIDHVSSEAGWYKGGQIAYIGSGVRSDCSAQSGDACAFRPWIWVHGAYGFDSSYLELETLSTVDACIKIQGTLEPRLKGGRCVTGIGGYIVDFTGGTPSTKPQVNIQAPTGVNLYRGTRGVDFTGDVTGVLPTGHFQAYALKSTFGVTQYGDTADFAPMDLSLTTAIGYASQNMYQNAGTSPAIHGLLAFGACNRVRVRVTTECIVYHQSATEPTAGNRIITPDGADTYIPAPASGGFNLLEFAYDQILSRWLYVGLAGKAVTSFANRTISGIKQALYAGEVDTGNSSTAKTIDWTAGGAQKSTLTGNCTYTFTSPGGVTSLVLKLVQDGTGGRTATWPASVKWAGGVAPTLSTAAGAVDIIGFYFDGTNYHGALNVKGSA